MSRSLTSHPLLLSRTTDARGSTPGWGPWAMEPSPKWGLASNLQVRLAVRGPIPHLGRAAWSILGHPRRRAIAPVSGALVGESISVHRAGEGARGPERGGRGVRSR